MDTFDHEEELRLGALCNRMGRLWADQEIDAWDDPPREAGLHVAHFKSESDKQRVLEGGPWQFSNHLVNFKPWIPNTPLPCYDFSTCAFWVHVVGLPLRAGRVRVELKLNKPLQTGQLIRIAGKVLWLDFRYERLSLLLFLWSTRPLHFYGKQVISEATEEVIPETPPFMITKVPALPPVEGTSVLQTVAAPSRHHLPTCASLLPSPSTALVTRPTLDQGGSKSSGQPPVAPLQQILPA